jgi:hypothetical protein
LNRISEQARGIGFNHFAGHRAVDHEIVALSALGANQFALIEVVTFS